MFQQKLIARSGLGNSTSMPPGITDALRRGRAPSLEEAKAESYTVLTSVVGDLLCKAGVAPAEVCCSKTCSHPAMLIGACWQQHQLAQHPSPDITHRSLPRGRHMLRCLD